jgi:hypothetical protein
MALGAYGLRLSGVDGLDEFLVEAPPDWSPVELILRSGTVATKDGWTERRRARFVTLSGSLVELDLDRGEAILTSRPAPRLQEVVHPGLSSVGAMAAHLMGNESFHAAAVATDAGAWGIVGDREAGKSSTLAALAVAGFPVVCDDTLALCGVTALAGPRSIDLRRDAAESLGLGDELGVVGTRERWRMRVEQVAPEHELRGWIFLEWSDELEIAPLPTSEVLSRLLRQRAVQLPPPEPTALFELAGLAGVLLRRPRGLDHLPATIEAIAETIRS